MIYLLYAVCIIICWLCYAMMAGGIANDYRHKPKHYKIIEHKNLNEEVYYTVKCKDIFGAWWTIPDFHDFGSPGDIIWRKKIEAQRWILSQCETAREI